MGLRGRQQIKDDIFFFVTTVVVNHIRIFEVETYCEILIKNIKHYQQRYKFGIIGYVIMPSHFHWIVEVDRTFGTISEIMRDIKKYSAWDLMDAISQDGHQEWIKVFRQASSRYKNQKRKLWEARFDDQAIHDEEMLNIKLEYIHNNPVKAGLVRSPEEYKYSSARNYILDDHSMIKVRTDWV